MKKLGLILALFASSAIAGPDCRWGVDHKHPVCYSLYQTQYYHHHGYRHPVPVYRNNDWVGPALVTIIGGAVVADIVNRNRQQQVIVQQQPMIVQQQVPILECTAWTERMQPDGTITRERICYNR